MKYSVAIVFLGLILTKSAIAQTAVSLNFKDKYVVGSGLVLVDSPIEQLNVFKEMGDGWYINFWSAINNHDRRVEEIDYSIGYYHSFGRTSVDMSLNYWDLYSLGSSEFDALVPSFEVKHELTENSDLHLYVQPTIVANTAGMSGVQSYVGVTHRTTVRPNTVLSTTFNIGYDSTYGADDEYAVLQMSPTYVVSEKLTFSFMGVTVMKTKENEEVIFDIFGLSGTF